MVKRQILLFTFFFFFCYLSMAQSYFFTKRNAKKISPSCYSLTENTFNQYGILWARDTNDPANPLLLDLQYKQELVYLINFGNKDNNGADGMAFVMHRDPAALTAYGEVGSGLGFGDSPDQPDPDNYQNSSKYIRNSVAIEFDTFKNNCAYYGSGTVTDDPLFDHTTVVYNGDVCRPQFPPVRIDPSNDNVETGRCYKVRIVWDPTQGVKQRLQLFVNDLKDPVFTYEDDMINNAFQYAPFSRYPQVYFGFTGSTGGVSNVQTICVYKEDTMVVAKNDTSELAINTQDTIDVISNDFKAKEDFLITKGVITSPEHGTALVLENQKLLYTPHPDYSGMDSLEYKVCNTDIDSCYNSCSTAWVHILIRDISTGLEEQQAVNPTLKFQPNPFTDFVTLYISEGVNIEEVEVRNVLGQVVKRLKREEHPRNNKWTWDGTDEKNKPTAPGIYFINIQNRKKGYSGKLLKID